jgi:Ca2+-transporting ATPase
MPVAKDASAVLPAETPLAERANLVFAGTSVASGRASAVVVATGAATELGQIGEMLRAAPAPERTPLQRNLDAFGRTLVWITLAIVACVFCLGLLRGVAPFELFLTSVALAVAAVPEGLPAVVTIALAVGVRRMAKRHALVRRLHAVETLGCTDVICADKTGTLTFGAMSVRALWAGGRRYAVTGEGYGPRGEVHAEGGGEDLDLTPARELLGAMVACNGARIAREAGTYEVVGDPTEGALLAAGTKVGLHLEAIDREQPRLFEIPFDNARKRMTIVRAREGRRRAYVKGAPEVLLDRCTGIWSEGGARPLGHRAREEVEAETERMSARALRVLLAAYRDLGPDEVPGEHVDQDLVLLGLAGMQDAPRPQARAAIARCRDAGVRVAMITGDHPQTASAVARELGLLTTSDAAPLTGTELDALPASELEDRAERVAVFARVAPAHKLRVVRALQARGHVVAMTGDGVNDAPAVRTADIGVAMGITGTEVTKSAAAMVITDDDFATIVVAIEQGRGIYANIRKALLYLLATNCAELMAIAGTLALGLPMPLLPLQILWINLVTDGLPALCLATDPIEPAVMRAPPRSRGERLADAHFLVHVLVAGAMTAATVLAVYLVSLAQHDLAYARAHAFSTIVAAQLLLSFTFRSPTKTLFEVGVATNLRLLLVVVASLALQAAAPHLPALGALLDLPPMPVTHLLVLAAVALLPVTAAEIVKLVRRRASGGATG